MSSLTPRPGTVAWHTVARPRRAVLAAGCAEPAACGGALAVVELDGGRSGVPLLAGALVSLLVPDVVMIWA